MNGTDLFKWNRQYAPTGEETPVGNWIVSRLARYGFAPKMDSLGNVLVNLGGKGKKILICVPYDQKGLLLTGRYSSGNFFVNLIGRWSADNLVGKSGITRGGKSAAIIQHIGAENYNSPYNLEVKIADSCIGIGDKIVFPAPEEEKRTDDSHLFSVSTLDNRAACYAVERFLANIKLEDLNAEVCVAFLALDSCSFRGVMAPLKAICPDQAISVNCKLDKEWHDASVIVNHVGNQYISDPTMVRNVNFAAKDQGLQTKHLFEYPISAGDVINTADSLVQYGCQTISVSIPVKENGCNTGYVSENCIDGMARLLISMVTK